MGTTKHMKMPFVTKNDKVILKHKSSNFVENFPKSTKKKLGIIIDHLKENPYSYPYKKIKGETNLYRIRIGGFRISYEIN